MATRYEKLEKLADSLFRRLTGVKRQTFEHMVNILQKAFDAKMAKGGRRPKLNVPDMLLLTLEYLREYRTYFHIAKSYGISESAAYKTIKWVENTLIKHPDFALPGRKALQKSDMQYEVILIDATESLIERPKKNKSISIQGKKSDIHSKANSW